MKVVHNVLEKNHGRHSKGFAHWYRSIFWYKKTLRAISYASIMSLVILCLCIALPVYNKDNYTEAATGTATPSTLTFTGTNLVASASLTVDSPTGTFATSTTNEKASFSISTNNYTGYTLTMKSSGNTTTLSDNNSNTITTISSSTTATNFASSGTTGQALNNKWGYIPNYYNATGSNPATNTTNYYPAPTSTNIATLRTTSSANSADGTSNADDYTIGLGVRADYTSPSGTYTNNTFILEYVVNPVTYAITYDANVGNSGDTVTNMPYSSNNNQQTGTTSSSTITLSNLVPARNKYYFLGWCLGSVTTTNGVDTCTGTTYNPNGNGTNLSLGLDQTITNTATLYAMWERYYTLTFLTANNATNVVFNGETYTNNQTKIIRASELTNPYHIYGNYATRYAFSSWTITAGTLGNQDYQNTTYTVVDDATITLAGQQVTLEIQNLSPSNCITTARPVYDNRDDSVYWVQRLADGNCWTLDNLALDLTDPTILSNIATTNTNVDTNSLVSLISGNRNNGNQYATASFSTWTPSNPDGVYSFAKANSDNKNLTLIPSDASPYANSVVGASGLGQNKVGVYYNYCAASAGNYCYGNGTSSGTSVGDANYDICPTGWRMPTGGTSSDYELLSANYLNNNTFINALAIPLSGQFTELGSANLVGEVGYLWSRTRASSSLDENAFMHLLRAESALASPYAGWRYLGLSVRCIIPIYTITFRTNNATGIVFDGVSYTDGQTLDVRADEVASKQYHIYGRYGTRYTFLSWNTTAGTFTNQNYQNTTFTITGNTTITLNGQYVDTAMQSLPPSGCTTTARPVYDTRDDSVYWIQKLADGNCWMLDNLELGSSQPTTNLSSNNTNIPPNYSFTLPASSSAWNTSNTTAYTTALINTDYADIGTTTYGLGGGKIGAYYNFCSASAGTYCHDSSSGTSDASYDICPKGWRMPYQYSDLFGAYSSDQSNFLTALSVTKSGEIWNSEVGKQGISSNLWSGKRKNDSTVSRMLLNDSGNVNAYADGPRGLGWSVRCVQSYIITFRTNNAAGIVFNGITYTDGQTVAIPVADAGVKKFSIYGAYGTRYAFSSWSKTVGTFDNQSLQNTTYTVTGDATITLTGQYVNTTMQNLSSSNCTTTARPVYDTRDNNVYWIRKLADNKCWMLDNLALDISNATIRNNLSASNTNATTASLNSLKGTSVRNPTTDPDGPYSTAVVTTSWDGERYNIPIADTRNSDATFIPGDAFTYANAKKGFFGAGKGKGGLYYNYCAASAGSYCYSEDKGVGDATEDICPAGWRIPTSHPQGEFWNLCSSLKGSDCSASPSESEQMDANSVNSMQYQLSTVFSGGIYSGGSPGSSSMYLWSSSRRGYSTMYYYVAYEDALATQNLDPRDIGRSVRCILK